MRAAIAGHPLHLDADVAELARHPAAPMDEFAIDNEPTADAGPEREQHHVFASARAAAPVFAERPGVGVVLEDDGASQQAFQMTPQRKASPRFHMRRGIDDAGANVEQAWHRHADRERAPEAFATRSIL